MGELLSEITKAVEKEHFVVSNHADDRLRERRIAVWQVMAELNNAKLIEERPSDRPYPSVVVEQFLADGAAVRVVWSWDRVNQLARLVTVHFIGR